MTGLFVVSGDITRMSVHVDCIGTLINSQGAWYGGVDMAIRRAAGNTYHEQAREVLLSVGLKNGNAFVTRGNQETRGWSFDDVVFIVDDFQSPLHKLVHVGLACAYINGARSIGLPLMRTGAAIGRVEPDLETVVQEMGVGIDMFLKYASGDDDMDIYVVVYNDIEAVKLLSRSMKLIT